MLQKSSGRLLTQECAEAALRVRFHDLPSDVRDLARAAVLDWIGVTIAGASEELSRILRKAVANDAEASEATIFGAGIKASVRNAALYNGAAAHALDYDDVSMAMIAHPSAAILPALFAVCEAEKLDGAVLIESFVAGYEAAAWLGSMIAEDHYNRGFHTTGTLCTIGAAIGCARALGCNEQEMRAAIGLACTQAAGLKCMFGTMTKPLHAGLSGERAILAARLAKAGFTSCEDAIENGQGFVATQTGGLTSEPELAGNRFHIRDNLIKYHASCFGTHSAIECVLQLRAQTPIPDEVASVVVSVGAECDSVCNIADPRTGLEAKFSIRFTTAMALCGRNTSDPNAFADHVVGDPSVRALLPLVTIRLIEGWSRTETKVELRLNDGRRLEAYHDVARPRPPNREQAKVKFLSLSRPRVGELNAQAIYSTVVGMGEGTDISALSARGM